MQYFFEHYGMENDETFQILPMHNQAFPAHVHRAYELICVYEGSLNLHIDQKRYVINSGEFAFVSNYQVHSFAPIGTSKNDVLIFSPEIIEDFYRPNKGLSPVNNILKMPSWLDINNLEGVYKRKAALYNICDLLLTNTSMEKLSSIHQATALQQIFGYIANNYGEDCSLRTVAKVLKYEYTYVSKLFSKFTGVSFTEYLNSHRISQACAILRSENMKVTVSEAADRCGYENLRTFHRNFRKIMGCSPQEYRETGE
ncbi:MAG: AraC family transcriptional regulator [Oscillospiraceae bacterium]|nr:AraC family transcriptional regulator [Oscillospiraceae bacterium]